MKTYSTYQEAKIANPECEIYKLECSGLFAYCDYHKADIVRFVECNSSGAKCNPADYCMTVEKLLSSGCKFVDGDIYLPPEGDRLVVVGLDGFSAQDANFPIPDDKKSHVLRAAAINGEEESRTNPKLHYTIDKPFLQTGEDYEHTKTLNFIRDRLVEVHGEPKNLDYMHKLNNAIAFVERMEEPSKLCGSGAGKEEKPKRTKVSYEKVDCKQFEFWECAKEYQSKMHIYWKDSKGKFVIQDLNQLVEQYKTGVIYRRVETETTEREEFIDELTSIQKVLGDCHLSDYYDALYDSGKFKLVN